MNFCKNEMHEIFHEIIAKKPKFIFSTENDRKILTLSNSNGWHFDSHFGNFQFDTSQPQRKVYLIFIGCKVIIHFFMSPMNKRFIGCVFYLQSTHLFLNWWICSIYSHNKIIHFWLKLKPVLIDKILLEFELVLIPKFTGQLSSKCFMFTALNHFPF